MQVVWKWVAQFLLIPLLKEFIASIGEKYRNSVELKRKKAEADLAVKNYESAKTVDEAIKEFEKLP